MGDCRNSPTTAEPQNRSTAKGMSVLMARQMWSWVASHSGKHCGPWNWQARGVGHLSSDLLPCEPYRVRRFQSLVRQTMDYDVPKAMNLSALNPAKACRFKTTEVKIGLSPKTDLIWSTWKRIMSTLSSLEKRPRAFLNHWWNKSVIMKKSKWK